jgi:hypothetical protein
LSGCCSLNSVTIYGSVSAIGLGFLYDCPSIKTINVPNDGSVQRALMESANNYKPVLHDYHDSGDYEQRDVDYEKHCRRLKTQQHNINLSEVLTKCTSNTFSSMTDELISNFFVSRHYR